MNDYVIFEMVNLMEVKMIEVIKGIDFLLTLIAIVIVGVMLGLNEFAEIARKPK